MILLENLHTATKLRGKDTYSPGACYLSIELHCISRRSLPPQPNCIQSNLNEPDNSEQLGIFLLGLTVCCCVYITVMSDILECGGRGEGYFV